MAAELVEVQYLMVENPVEAKDWQTVAAIRQVMLANAFSYLPIWWDGNWHHLSDHGIAKYLRTTSDRKKKMAKTVEQVLTNGEADLLEPAPWCTKECTADKIVAQMEDGKPVLVLDHKKNLLGLVAPADLL